MKKPFQRRSSGNSFSGKKFNRFDRGEKTMHKATCSDCGSRCEVPFYPTGNRPVLCNNCFKKDEPRFAKKNHSFSDRPSFEEKSLFHAECDSCGDDCQVPFKPNGKKPVYCQDCFGNGGRDPEISLGRSPQNSNEELRQIHAKLDQILEVLAKRN